MGGLVGAVVGGIKGLFSDSGKEVAGDLMDSGTKLVNAIKGKDPEMERQAMDFLARVNEAQARINEENAKLGRGSWRSALGWVGVYGIGYNYLFIPTMYVFNIKIPALDLSELIGLIVLLLGGAGIKVAEKKVVGG